MTQTTEQKIETSPQTQTSRLDLLIAKLYYEIFKGNIVFEEQKARYPSLIRDETLRGKQNRNKNKSGTRPIEENTLADHIFALVNDFSIVEPQPEEHSPHFNIIPATIFRLIEQLQEFDQTEELYILCNLFDDEGRFIFNGTVAFMYASRIIEIINNIGDGHYQAKLELADIGLGTYDKARYEPTNQSHYRVAITSK